MSITFKDVLKLAKGAHSVPELRSVVFDGTSAMTAAQMDWVVGVPCAQPALIGREPVVVPVDAITAHMLKSRHLVVMPDHLTNGQGLVTPFGLNPKLSYGMVLDMLPKQPQGEAVSFDLELDALDRVLVAAGQQDIRYYLNGIMLDLTDGMLVGCDGHRLHVYQNRVPKAFKRRVVDGVPQSGPVEMVLPRDPMRWMVSSASMAAKVTIWNALPGKDPAQVLMQTDDAFLWIRKPIVGKFPDWRRVMPAVLSRPVWFELNPADLSDKVTAMGKVVKLSSAGKRHGVRVDIGRASIHGERDEDVLPLAVTLHSDRVELDLESLREDLFFGVNADYLQDLADCVTAGAQWRIDHTNCKNQSVLVVDGDFSGVVMLLRVDEPVKAAKAEPKAEKGPQEPQEPAKDSEPEEIPAEPCPAAVAAIAAQLVAQVVDKAQEAAKKAPRRAAKVKKELAPA